MEKLVSVKQYLTVLYDFVLENMKYDLQAAIDCGNLHVQEQIAKDYVRLEARIKKLGEMSDVEKVH